MKLKLKVLVPILLAITAAPALAHVPDDDEDGPWPPVEQDMPKDAQVDPKSPEAKPPAKKGGPGPGAPTTPAPAQPKKP